MSSYETVTPEQVPAGAKIIDVREDNEWEAGHAVGATHIPLGELPGRLDEIDPDEDNYVICRSGGRSARAAEWLTGQGYTAINIAGGSGAWLEAELPMESHNGQAPTVN